MERAPFLLPIILAVSGLLSSCAHQAYEARPLDAQATAEDFTHRTAESAGLAEASNWDLNALTKAALLLHPDMQVARKRWLEAQARQVIGIRMPRPTALENASFAEKRVAR